MELSTALSRRRSCRSFSPTPVDPDTLDAILSAARRAPTAGNSWALDIVALTTPASTGAYWATTLSDDRRVTFPWPGLLRAPVLLIPTVRSDAYVERYSEPDKARTGLGDHAEAWPVPYWWVDGGAAVMAMLLAATDAGLGSLLFGAFEHEAAVARRFAIPEDRRILGTIAIGHPDDLDRRSLSGRRVRPELGDFVHHEQW